MNKMNKKELSEKIIKDVGGKKNIINYSHCSTRLRFDLKNKDEVNREALERLDGVMSVVEVADQLQIVIGSGVVYLYDELSKILTTTGEHDSKSGEKKSLVAFFIELVSSLFTPIIDVLIGAGILKGLLSILLALNVLNPTSGTYEILNAAADSLYYFLPIILAVTASRRFKTNLFVSITIAGALLYPNISALYNVGEKIDFLGIPVTLTAFQSSVFPIIFAIILLMYVEKMETKFLPESIRSRIAPFFSLIIVVPITIIIFGPLGAGLSQVIATVYTSMYNFNPILAGGFVGALAQVMVVFGIHWGLFPIIFSNIEKFGYDTILAVFGPSIIAQSGATFGVYLRTKNKELKKLTTSTTVMGFFGISEPAIYGVNLKYRKPFIMALIGGGIGGAIAGATGARAMAVAVAAVPTFPAYFGVGFVGFLVAYFSAFIISAILTYIWGFNDDMIEEENTVKNDKDSEVKAAFNEEDDIHLPVDGAIIDIHTVSDKVFSSESMGKSVAISPIDNIIYAPINGIVEMVFPTKHAYGLKSEHGLEILVHIGLDTVKLNGKYFESYVKTGDVILKGDKIGKFNLEKLKSEGYDPTVIMVFTNTTDNSKVIVNQNVKQHTSSAFTVQI